MARTDHVMMKIQPTKNGAPDWSGWGRGKPFNLLHTTIDGRNKGRKTIRVNGTIETMPKIVANAAPERMPL